MEIRLVNLQDSKEILDIYKPYISNSVITFETTIPTIEDFTNRIKKIKTKYPYLVVIDNNRVVGYAYLSFFKDRKAYDCSAEISIYLDKQYQNKGLGFKLYQTLFDIAKRQNIVNIYACITYPNDQSIGFHQKLGFEFEAKFEKCGYKFGTWLDVVFYKKVINEYGDKDFIKFDDLE